MKIDIKDIILPLTILQKKSDLERGLRGKTSISGCYLFMLHNEDDDGEHGFWMKDCKIPLDIIFCNNNQIIKIFHNCPPCNGDICPHYVNTGNVVLELEGGFCENNNITEGDTFIIHF